MTSLRSRIALAFVFAAVSACALAVEFVRQPSLFAENAPSGLEDRYGSVLAIDGDTLAVGVGKGPGPVRVGEVDIYVRRGDAWERQATLRRPSVSGNFGQSLALEGDLLVVGAPSGGSADDTGQIVPYRRVGNEWIKEPTLQGMARSAGDSFGHALAIEDGRILVGAPGRDGPGGANQGALYVFEYTGTRWRQSGYLQAPDGRADDLLGASVAWSGPLALGGALGRDVGAASGQGAVEVFARGDFEWRHALTLLAPDGAGGESFGFAIAADAQRLVVGAHLDAVDGRAGAGSARVFERSGENFAPLATLSDTSGATSALGYAVTLAGDTIALGGRTATPLVFRREVAGWVRAPSPDALSGDPIEAVVAGGGTLVYAAPSADVGTSIDRGVLAIAARNDANWDAQALLTSREDTVGTTFGYRLDIDQGRAVIGGPAICSGFCPPTWGPGAAYFFERAADGTLAHVRTRTGEPARFGDGFGHAVALRGERAIVATGGSYDWLDRPGVFVHEREGGAWVRRAELRDAQDAPLAARYVAIDGDLAAVATYFDLWLFARGADGVWRNEARFPAGLRGAYSLSALVLDGSTLAMGLSDFSGEAAGQGLVYVLARHEGRWSIEARLAGDNKAGAGFGSDLALDGGHLLVGEGDFETRMGGGVLAYERTAAGWQSRGRLAMPSTWREGPAVTLRGDHGFAFAAGTVYAYEFRGGRWEPAGTTPAVGPALAFDGETLLVSRWSNDLDQMREVEVYRIVR